MDFLKKLFGTDTGASDAPVEEPQVHPEEAQPESVVSEEPMEEVSEEPVEESQEEPVEEPESLE